MSDTDIDSLDYEAAREYVVAFIAAFKRTQKERAIAQSIHKRQSGVPLSPYLESGGTDGLVYRTAGIPTWASSGIFIKPDEMYAHGLDERIPVQSFYDGIEHIHDLAVALGKN